MLLEALTKAIERRKLDGLAFWRGVNPLVRTEDKTLIAGFLLEFTKVFDSACPTAWFARDTDVAPVKN